MLLEMSNKVNFGYDSIDEAFPLIDPGVKPLGSMVLCQIRTPKSKTKGGIILTEEVRETDLWNTQVAKVIAVGPLAFHNRNTGLLWVEGAWCAVGDFVRVPRHKIDRWTVKADIDGETVEAMFGLVDDLSLLGTIDDPLAMVAFI